MVGKATVDPTRLHVETHHVQAWKHPPSFHDIMAERLTYAPWLGISIVVHVIAGLILWQIPVGTRQNAPRVAIAAEQMQPEEELIEEPEPEIVEKPKEKAESEPVLQDAEVTEIVETSEDAFTETDTEAAPDFDANAFNDVIGVGGGAGGKFGSRGTGRRALGRKGGRPSAMAIQLGLEWLAAHQSEDGSWSATRFTERCPASGACDGPGNSMNDIGITGLALLAFLGDGSTMRSGPFKAVVKRGVIWLKDQQDDNGLFGTQAGRQFMYNHALASLAMVEAYGLSKYRTLKRYAQRCVNYILDARNPYRAWRYYPQDGENDTSMTGWMVFVLKSAQDFELKVDEAALSCSLEWFDEVTDPKTGQCGYIKLGDGSSREKQLERWFPRTKTEALTAVGLLCRIFLGERPEDQPLLGAAAKTMLAKPPAWNGSDGTIDLYYWYYGSYGMFQLGGDLWKRWRRHLESALIKTQRKDGHARGSWDPIGAWGHEGGRVYSTAIGVLCLEVYYRYSRLLR